MNEIFNFQGQQVSVPFRCNWGFLQEKVDKAISKFSFRTLPRWLGCLTYQRVVKKRWRLWSFRPLSRWLGCLTYNEPYLWKEPWFKFLSPFEVTGVSYLAKEIAEENVDIVFPYPPEVNGDCYQMEQILPIMAWLGFRPLARRLGCLTFYNIIFKK